jgi:hypothetical protein
VNARFEQHEDIAMAKEFRGRYQVHGSRADETALDRRSLTLGAALLTSLAAAPIAEADDASTEPAESQTHLAEVPLASGATLTIKRRGRVALFGINGLIFRTASISKLSGRSRRPTTTTITTRR